MSTTAKIMTLKPFFKHPSIWFEKNQEYAYLLHQDLKIREYMEGLFYRLKIPSSDYTFERYHNALVVRHHIYLEPSKYFEMNRPVEHFLVSKELEQLKDILTQSGHFGKWDKLDNTTRDKLLKYMKDYQFEYWDKEESYRASAKNLWAGIKDAHKIQSLQVSQREAQKLKNHLMKFFPAPMVDHFINTMKNVETDELNQLLERENARKQLIEDFKNDSLFLKKQYVKDGYTKLLPHLDKLESELRHRNVILNKLDQIKSPINYAFVDTVQKSLTEFASTPVYYLPVVYEKNPPMVSARLVAEFVRHKIETGSDPRKVFNEVKEWQLREIRSQREMSFQELSPEVKHRVADRFLDTYLEDENIKDAPLPYMLVPAMNNDFTRRQFKQFVSTKLFPLVGIRIRVSGLLTAAARSQKLDYDEIIGHDYAGRMNHSAITADVDYYDTFARRNEGSLGIKVWLMFRTKVTTTSGLDRSLVV